MPLQNPIIRGFSPDPSLVRVGEDYYLVNSSFEYFPGVPIRHSRDLANWTLIGHCLTRPSQLPLEGLSSSLGIFAPTIRHHDGRFYMVTTNVAAGGNFLVTAEDIRGPWSDPIHFAVDSIDPSLFWDEDGTCYLTVQGSEGIRQAEFEPLTGELRSDLRLIWTGTGGQWPEGPHLFKRNGTYYLTLAEGGTEYGHMQTLARSDSPWGPFEPCPHNPILSHRSLNHPFQAIGHADFFQDPQGNWWAVCLGIRPKGYPYGHNLGRETLLVPVQWDEAGWPYLGDQGRVPMTLDLDVEPVEPRPEVWTFPEGEIPLEWSFLRNPNRTNYSAAPNGGIRLHGTEASLADPTSPTWIGRPQAHFRARFAADCDASALTDGEGGISLRMNEKHRIELYLTPTDIELSVTIGPLSQIVASFPAPLHHAVLEVVVHPEAYEFNAECAGEHLHLGRVPSHYFSTEVAGGFTGVMLGLYAHCPSGTGALDVRQCVYEPLGD